MGSTRLSPNGGMTMAEWTRDVVYEEVQRWPWWVALVILAALAAAAVVVLNAPPEDRVIGWALGLAPMLAITVVLALLFDRLRIQVTRSTVVASFGTFGWIRKRIPLDDIQEMEAVRYGPIRDFGGWGIRFSWTDPSKRAWTIRGDRALRLRLADGTDFHLGCAHPQRLMERIRTVRDAGHSTS